MGDSGNNCGNHCGSDCCPPMQSSCCEPQGHCCDSGSNWGILLLLLVLYFLFCGNDNRGGGLFGGLF